MPEAAETNEEPDFDRLLETADPTLRPLVEMQERLSRLRSLGTAADGLVSVELDPGGALTSVNINPRAMRMGAQALAEAVTQAAADAAQHAAEAVDALILELAERMDSVDSDVLSRVPGLGLPPGDRPR